MKYLVRVGLFTVMLGMFATQVSAQGLGPPTAPPSPGGILLDLAGTQAYLSTYDANTGECVNGQCVVQNYNSGNSAGLQFTVPDGASLTTLTFTFRNDPGFFGFTNALLLPQGDNNPADNLLHDGSFTAPFVGATGITDSSASICSVNNPTPAGLWCNFNQNAAGHAGRLTSNQANADPSASPYASDGNEADGSGTGLIANGGSGAAFWVDGATQAYDGLYQTVALTGGQTYDLSFDLMNINAWGNGSPFGACSPSADYVTSGGNPVYSQLSSNKNTDFGGVCGNGVDMLVYAGYPDLPTPQTPPGSSVPEPATLALLGSGLFGIGVLRRRRR